MSDVSGLLDPRLMTVATPRTTWSASTPEEILADIVAVADAGIREIDELCERDDSEHDVLARGPRMSQLRAFLRDAVVPVDFPFHVER